MRSRVSVLGSTVLLAVALSACGGSDGASTSTLPPEDATVFKTIPTTSTTLSPTTIPGQGGVPQEVVYEVKPNDTWIGISKQFGCANYLELIAYNDNRQSIFPGETVNIPSTCGQTPTDTTPASDGSGGTSASGGTSTATTTTAAADPNSASYTIAAGDTLSGIAAKFDTTMGAIVSLNGWGGIDHVLIPGKDIKIPVAG